jgi:IS5 family transposase
MSIARRDWAPVVRWPVRDRLSFSRFLGLAIEDSISDSTTLWLFRCHSAICCEPM